MQRDLNRIKAKLIQRSVWKSEDLEELVKIGIGIRRLGGRAEILEERFLF